MMFRSPDPDIARAMRRRWWLMALVVIVTMLALFNLCSPSSLDWPFDTLLVGAYGGVAGFTGYAVARLVVHRRLRKS